MHATSDVCVFVCAQHINIIQYEIYNFNIYRVNTFQINILQEFAWRVQKLINTWRSRPMGFRHSIVLILSTFAVAVAAAIATYMHCLLYVV